VHALCVWGRATAQRLLHCQAFAGGQVIGEKIVQRSAIEEETAETEWHMLRQMATIKGGAKLQRKRKEE
jgi:hypothetical protein